MNPTGGGTSVADLSTVLAEVARARTAVGAQPAALLLVEVASGDRPSLLPQDGARCWRSTEAAARVQGAMECSGTVAVVGPGHLAVLAPRTGPRRAVALARSIQRALREAPDGTLAALTAGPAGVGIRTLESGCTGCGGWRHGGWGGSRGRRRSPGSARLFPGRPLGWQPPGC